MTRKEAQTILALYPRVEPGPEVSAALALVESDPELRRWLMAQEAFNVTAGTALSRIPAPEKFKQKILQQKPIVVKPSFWRKPAVLALAAAFIALAGLALFFNPAKSEKHFDTFRSRMVRTVLREYRMDIVTNNLAVIRNYFQENGAPANYQIHNALEKLQVTGAGVLRWQNQPVSMICFDRGDSQMVFLFVAPRESTKPEPPASPVLEQVSHLLTASWTQGDKTYILAGPPDTELIKQL